MAGKMKECRWLAPAPVGQFEFVEWTPDGQLRHSRFMELRDGKKPREVVREDRCQRQPVYARQLFT
jgi:bifunctional non-homologous end joining protein LigD